MDPASITAFASAGTQLVGLVKTAIEAVKSTGKPEAVSRLAEVQAAMMDLLQKQQALIDENRTLQERVRQLEGELEIKAALVPHHNAYWWPKDEGLDGPFSLTQWDIHRKLVRMRFWRHEKNGSILYHEPNSKDNAWVPLPWAQQQKVLGLREISEPAEEERFSPDIKKDYGR
jgi:hypothetical protein